MSLWAYHGAHVLSLLITQIETDFPEVLLSYCDHLALQLSG